MIHLLSYNKRPTTGVNGAKKNDRHQVSKIGGLGLVGMGVRWLMV
jgi:hypothetical protein